MLIFFPPFTPELSVLHRFPLVLLSVARPSSYRKTSSHFLSHNSFLCRCLSESKGNCMADSFRFIVMIHWVVILLSYFSWTFPGIAWLYFMSESRSRMLECFCWLLKMLPQISSKRWHFSAGQVPAKADHRSPSLEGLILCDIIRELQKEKEPFTSCMSPWNITALFPRLAPSVVVKAKTTIQWQNLSWDKSV